jgi:hypothetical protein
LTDEQRKELLKVKGRKKRLGLRASIDSTDLLKHMPSLLENSRIKTIKDGLYWISTHRFWFYFMDYLLMDIFLIMLIGLKNSVELFKYGNLIGKMDILVNLVIFYGMYRFFKWKHLVIKRLKKLNIDGIEVRRSAASSVSGSLDPLEMEYLSKRKEEEKFYYKWVFIMEEFTYKFKPRKVRISEKEVEVKQEKNDDKLKIGGEVVEQSPKNSQNSQQALEKEDKKTNENQNMANDDEAPKGAESTVQAVEKKPEDQENKSKDDKKSEDKKKAKKKKKKYKKPKDWKFIRRNQILIQDLSLFLMAVVLVFGS